MILPKYIDDIRGAITDLKDMYEANDRRDFIEQWDDERIEVDGDLWIKESVIDELMQDELSSDEYVLGCFNASFLASILNLDTESIEILQQNDGYEGLGKAIINGGHIEELQQSYVHHDGYGHHFNAWDGSEEFHRIAGVGFYRFPMGAR